jgi:HSP20 family molecular chaperone IbpA
MADPRSRHIKSIVDRSRHLDADDLVLNLEAELERLEQGLGHMIWDNESRPVTMCPCLLPISPWFEVSETEDEYSVKMYLPGVREENIDARVERGSVEVFARPQEKTHRPFLLSIEPPIALDPSSIRLESRDDVFVVRVRTVKRLRVKIK